MSDDNGTNRKPTFTDDELDEIFAEARAAFPPDRNKEIDLAAAMAAAAAHLFSKFRPELQAAMREAFERGRAQVAVERAGRYRLDEPISEPALQLAEGDPDCPDCHGAGYFKMNVQPSAPGFGRMHICACHPHVMELRAAEAALRWADSGIPAGPMRSWSFLHYSGQVGRQEAIEAARTIERTGRGWLYLHGDYGRGKTGIGVCLVNEFIRQGRKARLVLAADILLELRATFADDARTSEKDVTDRYDGYDLLVVDEMDPERFHCTPWARQALFRLLDARYRARGERATVFTSNKAPAELPQPDWSYLVSRVRDGDVIAVLGDDLRGGA